MLEFKIRFARIGRFDRNSCYGNKDQPLLQKNLKNLCKLVATVSEIPEKQTARGTINR
jgi:hypothetical protein